ncbi:hypothetical protein JTB14_014068 [Gonioctena quinquepunctata]|nr:hypothetical protein JTB14_014068 [Gonioctena quinquepunctata]
MKVELEEVIYKPTSYEIANQELKPLKEKKKPDTLFLYFSVITVNLLAFALGSMMTWTSPVIPKLKSDDPEVNPLGRSISTYEISLIVGLPSLTLLLSTLILAKLCDKIGRKRTLQYMSIGMILSSVLMAFGKHVYMFVIGRCLFTVCVGVVSIAIPVYISEITENHNRGKFGCMLGMFVPLGNLYSFLVGPFTTVRDFTLLCSLPPVLSLIALTFFIPETPVYLMREGDKNEAQKVLRKFRNNKSLEEIQSDCEKIEHSLKINIDSKKPGWKTLFQSRVHRKALLIVIGTTSAQQMSGSACIMSYMAPIFNETGSKLSGNAIAMIVGVVKVCTMFATTIPIFLLGLFFYWKDNDATFIDNIRLMPVICVVTFIVAYSLGLGAIPMVLVGDLFPSELRSLAVSLTTIMTTLEVGVSASFSVPFLYTSSYLKPREKVIQSFAKFWKDEKKLWLF